MITAYDKVTQLARSVMESPTHVTLGDGIDDVALAIKTKFKEHDRVNFAKMSGGKNFMANVLLVNMLGIEEEVR